MSTTKSIHSAQSTSLRDPSTYIPRPTSAKTPDVSHILTSLFGLIVVFFVVVVVVAVAIVKAKQSNSDWLTTVRRIVRTFCQPT